MAHVTSKLWSLSLCVHFSNNEIAIRPYLLSRLHVCLHWASLHLALQALMCSSCMQRSSEYYCFFCGTDKGGMCGVRIARSTDPLGQPGSW